MGVSEERKRLGLIFESSSNKKKKRRKKSDNVRRESVCKGFILVHVCVHLPARVYQPVVSDPGCHVSFKQFV